MALQLMTATNQNVVAPASGDDDVVGNQSMSPLDKVQHAFGFSNSASAGEEKSDAKDVGE
jgi:hypothetical protein